MQIAGREIGPGCPPFVVAELSGNHNGSFEAAAACIRAAKEAGADAVKIQTYTADTLTIQCDRSEFRIGGGTIWDGRTFYDLYREAHTPWEWQPRLMKIAHDLGLPLFSTPFDKTAVAFLERMQVPAYKVASPEIVDIPLLKCVASTGKPVILSTGMATLDEIHEAVAALRANGSREIALLHCVSAYPAPPEDMNLATIPDLARVFNCPTGLSDHTVGCAVAVAAVVLGASIVEKHLTLSRAAGGPDALFSLEPDEYKALVRSVHEAAAAVGKVSYGLTPSEQASSRGRRSLFVIQDIKKGEKFTGDNVRSIRPGHGLHPRHYDEVMGKKAARNIARGEPLEQGMIS